MFLQIKTLKKKLIILSIIPFAVMTVIVFGVMIYNDYIVNEHKEILDNLFFYKELSASFNRLDYDFNSLFVRSKELEKRNEKIIELQDLHSEVNRYAEKVYYSAGWSEIYGLGNMLGTYENNINKLFILIGKGEPYYDALKYNRSVAVYINKRIDLIVSTLLDDSSALYEKMSSLGEKLNIMLVFSLIMLISLLVFYIYKFSEHISTPVMNLSKKAERFASGDINVSEVIVKSNDEISVLANSFNEMLRKIRLLIQKIIDQSELEKKLKEEEMKNLRNVNMIKEAEIKMLRSQMNPHFLFNTLNTISKISMIENAMTTNSLIQSTSQLLRYNLENERKERIFLRDEIENIKEYILIYKTRFLENFDYKFNIENSLLDIRVPYFILQPLVENAIIHGIEPMPEKGTLEINVYPDCFCDEDVAVIEIIDNGVGIDERKLQDILSSDNGGIGINNVKKRIEYFFGRKDLFHINNLKKHGTFVKILIPYTNRNVEAI